MYAAKEQGDLFIYPFNAEPPLNRRVSLQLCAPLTASFGHKAVSPLKTFLDQGIQCVFSPTLCALPACTPSTRRVITPLQMYGCVDGVTVARLLLPTSDSMLMGCVCLRAATLSSTSRCEPSRRKFSARAQLSALLRTLSLRFLRMRSNFSSQCILLTRRACSQLFNFIAPWYGTIHDWHVVRVRRAHSPSS